MRLKVPGGDHSGVVDALEFIAAYKTAQITGATGKVAVIGAGNTAIDAANAARRLGAENVSILYRRKRETCRRSILSTSMRSRRGCGSCGRRDPGAAERRWRDCSNVLECARVDDALSRLRGRSFHLTCDLIIPAIGQSPLLELLESVTGVVLDAGRVVVERRQDRRRIRNILPVAIA